MTSQPIATTSLTEKVEPTNYYCLPTGELVDYSYDAAWRATHMCSRNLVCYTYDAAYDALAQPTSMGFGNNFSQYWSYDTPMARLSTLKIGNGSSLVSNRSYSYDAVGNVKTITEFNLAQPQVENFTYDHRDRLTRGWTTGDPAYGYDTGLVAYNAIGNLVSRGSVGYSYPPSGATSVRPHAVTMVGGSTSYTYDAGGNLVQGGGRSIIWNSQLQPSAIQGTDGVWESYTYDADGGRASKVRGGGPQTVSLFNGLVEVQEGAMTARTQYPFNGRVVAQRTLTDTSNTVVYLHGDHLGSTLILSRQNGTYTGQKRDDTGLLEFVGVYAAYVDSVPASCARVSFQKGSQFAGLAQAGALPGAGRRACPGGKAAWLSLYD